MVGVPSPEGDDYENFLSEGGKAHRKSKRGFFAHLFSRKTLHAEPAVLQEEPDKKNKVYFQ